MHKLNGLNQPKISPEFATRLNRLEPQQRVRVMVLLQSDTSQLDTSQSTDSASLKSVTRSNPASHSSSMPHGRQSHRERRAQIQAIRQSSGRSLDSISRILQRFGGCLLATRPDALGAIPVEITAAGVKALATSEAVKAILEDQAVALGKFGKS
jgi:hypothetical protein